MTNSFVTTAMQPLITALGDGFVVRHGSQTVDHLDTRKPTVEYWLSSVTRLDGGQRWQLEITTWVLIGDSAHPRARHDALDAALVDYLAAVETISAMSWTRVQWGVLEQLPPGYQIILTAIATVTPNPESE